MFGMITKLVRYGVIDLEFHLVFAMDARFLGMIEVSCELPSNWPLMVLYLHVMTN
jgi:hypothetical protein